MPIGDLLVSHAQIVVPEVIHDGHAMRIAGVGGVMTYPQFRGEGHGTAVMQHATVHILADPSFDVGMLFCAPETVAFYRRFGWSVLPAGRVHVGTADGAGGRRRHDGRRYDRPAGRPPAGLELVSARVRPAAAPCSDRTR